MAKPRMTKAEARALRAHTQQLAQQIARDVGRPVETADEALQREIQRWHRRSAPSDCLRVVGYDDDRSDAAW